MLEGRIDFYSDLHPFSLLPRVSLLFHIFQRPLPFGFDLFARLLVQMSTHHAGLPLDSSARIGRCRLGTISSLYGDHPSDRLASLASSAICHHVTLRLLSQCHRSRVAWMLLRAYEPSHTADDGHAKFHVPACEALRRDCPLGIYALIASCCCCRIAFALVLIA